MYCFLQSFQTQIPHLVRFLRKNWTSILEIVSHVTKKKEVYMCIVCFGRYIWIRSSKKLSFILTHEKPITWCADYGSVTISTNSLLNKGMSTQLPNLYSSISYRKYFHNIYRYLSIISWLLPRLSRGPDYSGMIKDTLI